MSFPVFFVGETDWVREMIDRYDDKARETGARIVHFCGLDCVPWDLLALASAEKLKKDNKEDLVSFRAYDQINFVPSGGTLATILHVLDTFSLSKASKLGFNPLLKTIAGTKSEGKFRVSHTPFLTYSSEAGAWVGPFVMITVMSDCAKRSNAVLNYGPNVTYALSDQYPSFFAGFVTLFTLLLVGTVLISPVFRAIAKATILPAPGQGPSESAMDNGFLKLTGFATGSKGTTVKSTIYYSTGKMISIYSNLSRTFCTCHYIKCIIFFLFSCLLPSQILGTAIRLA